MSLKFFSQFLQIEKLVSQEHLDEAIAQAGVSTRRSGIWLRYEAFLPISKLMRSTKNSSSWTCPLVDWLKSAAF